MNKHKSLEQWLVCGAMQPLAIIIIICECTEINLIPTLNTVGGEKTNHWWLYNGWFCLNSFQKAKLHTISFRDTYKNSKIIKQASKWVKHNSGWWLPLVWVGRGRGAIQEGTKDTEIFFFLNIAAKIWAIIKVDVFKRRIWPKVEYYCIFKILCWRDTNEHYLNVMWNHFVISPTQWLWSSFER